jgi:AcrR family transcriptional regulator
VNKVVCYLSNTRERILNACLDLARDRGFYNMPMEELADRAG